MEQARVESIGARRMSGVAANIGAMLEDRYQRGHFADVTSRKDAPLEDALALIARERLTGEPPPPHGQKIVALWRDFIEARGGGELDKLSPAIENQKSFAHIVQRLLANLDMPGAEQNQEHDSDESDEDQPQNKDENAGEQDQADAAADASDLDSAMASEDQLQEGESQSAEAPYGETDDMSDAGDSDDASDARRPHLPASDRSGSDYRPFTAKFDEIINAEELCEPEELDRLRSNLDKQLAHLRAWWRASPTGCSAG